MWVGFVAQNHENIVCELLKNSAAFCQCRQVVKICKEKKVAGGGNLCKDKL